MKVFPFLFTATLVTAAPTVQERAITSINSLFVAKGKKYYGTASDPNLLSNTQNADVIKSAFGQITPENSMKWDATEGTKGTFTFTNADTVVKFAQDNNMPVRGHALIWHSQLPTWVSDISDKAELTSVIENHITGLVSHFKGKIYAWDVVNEIFNDDGTMRDTVFYRVLGEDFVSIAFKAARAADPDAKLYLNDYNLLTPTTAKLANGIVPKVKEWIKAGIPIDGIGSQSHLETGASGGTQGALEALADSGVSEIAITELDVVGADSDDYVAVTNACLNVPKCVGITVWGVRDADS